MSNAKRRYRRRRRAVSRVVFEFMGRRWSAIWHPDGHVQMVPGYYDRYLPGSSVSSEQ